MKNAKMGERYSAYIWQKMNEKTALSPRGKEEEIGIALHLHFVQDSLEKISSSPRHTKEANRGGGHPPPSYL